MTFRKYAVGTKLMQQSDRRSPHGKLLHNVKHTRFFKENLQLHKSPSLVPSLTPVPSLPFLSLPFLPSPPLLLPSPFQRGSGGITPGKCLELEMLVGEFQSILDIKINTVMNQVFKRCLLFRDLCLILTMFSGWCSLYDPQAKCQSIELNYGKVHRTVVSRLSWLTQNHTGNN